MARYTVAEVREDFSCVPGHGNDYLPVFCYVRLADAPFSQGTSPMLLHRLHC